jgi:hypothetical protein
MEIVTMAQQYLLVVMVTLVILLLQMVKMVS